IARPGGPYAGETGKPISFIGTESSDPEGQSLTYAWTFGDGGTATGASATHTYQEPGTFSVELTVRDSEGATSSASTTVTVVRANRPPVANAGGPYTGDATQALTLSATSSTDPDGDALTFSWNLGDLTSATGAIVRRAYTTPGTYTATVTVSDGRGGTATATALVTIRALNQRPLASIGGPYSGDVGRPITFNGAGSSDPDSDALSYTWNFGDGSTATGVSPAHAFAAAGTFAVTLTVSDGRGGSNSASTQVPVAPANQQPVARIDAPARAQVGDTLAFSAAGSTDADQDLLTFSWSFGDGRGATGTNVSHAFEQAGSFTVLVTANDGRGATGTASATVVVDPAPQENRPPVANAGGPYTGEASLPLVFDGSKSSDPDRETITYAWDFGDGSTGTGAAPSHAYVEPRAYTVTLTVTDARGATATSTASVSVAPRADRAPPIVSVTAPREVLPGTRVTLRAQASDNVGVTSLVFEVDGQPGSPIATAPFERDLDIPTVAAPGARITVRAIARDAAGNNGVAEASLTIAALPDSQPPVVSLQLPPRAAPGATIRISATATDNDGIGSVVFRSGATTLSSAVAAPFEATYVVPGDAIPGASITFAAEATDHTGNRATASGVVTIVDVPDTTPPTVQLTAPATVAPGGTIDLLAAASDEGGVSAVILTVDNARIATLTSPPYSATYQVPASAVPGTTFRFEARAVDSAGLESSAVQLTQLAVPTSTDGFVVGEVYDDATGLPLAGATVTVRRGTAAPVVATADERGRFALPVAPGAVHVHIERSGYTDADRFAAIVGGQAAILLDARLTPRSGSAKQISPVLGGTLDAGDLQVAVPAGSLTAATSLWLTKVGQQGIQSPLPPGWSPVAVADLSPRGAVFAAPATLRAKVPSSIAAGTPLVLVQWDVEARGWRAVQQGAAPSNGTSIEGAIAQAGQFAWIVADGQPAVPPMPANGAIIGGVTLADVPTDVTTAITPQPNVIFYQPGVHSDVTGTLTAPAALPSGTRLWARTTESYRFRNGVESHPDPTVQDLTLYQTATDGRHLAASYVATPSRQFDPLSLERGIIGLELYVPPADAAPALITAAGGAAQAETGERIEFPQGTVGSPVAVAIGRITAADLGLAIPAPLTYLGAVDLSITGGTVTGSGLLSIPKPADLPSGAQVLVTRLVTLGDSTRFVLVALAAVDGDRLVAQPLLPNNRVEMEGVRESGRYVFVSTSQPVGFFTGRVIDGAGHPVPGAQVSSDPFPVVALARAVSAVYVAPAAIGEATVLAVELASSDRGSVTATTNAAGDEVLIDIRLAAEPPRIISITPANNALNVALSSPVVVVFSEAIDPATVSGAGAANAVLFDAASQPVPATVTLSAGNTLLTVRPVAALQPNAAYSFGLAAAIADMSGQTLGTPVTIAFTSLDTQAPPPPAAGTVTAGIPENGSTTIRAAQGIAGLHDTVSIENVTRGTSTPVLLDPNGGFLVLVQASLGDRLKVRIVDQAGNETFADVPGFTRQNADGSISGVVGGAGGRVDGPNGTAVQVPEGSLPDGTIVTVKSIAEADFPVVLEPNQKAVFPFAGGVQVDFGGVTPARYVNVSIPAQPGDKPGDQWVVAQATMVGGQQVLNTADTAKLIDGRVQTSSPPCPGVLAAGLYGIYKSVQPLGLAWGRMYQNGSYNGLRMTIEVPPSLGGKAMPYASFAWESPFPICLPM
ncbi:MAG TPA: PKD domain-containing protein, partial [Vicinamibacterales bacterium]